MRKPKTKCYTVLLNYPDSDDPVDVCRVWTRAETVGLAVKQARECLAKDNGLDIEACSGAEVIAVYGGWRIDVYDGSCD